MKRVTHLIDYTTGGLGGFVNANPGLADFARRGLLGARLRGLAFDTRPAAWSIESARNALADYLAYDRDIQFVSEYLVKVDGSTMHYALEARAPFLDHVLWEYAASLPFDVRLRGGVLKAVLREIARRRVTPRVADGSKRGFSIPVEAWMANRWHGRVVESFADSIVVSDGWVERRALQRELADAVRHGEASRRLWYLWVLEEWMRYERQSRSGGGRLDHAGPATTSASPSREASLR
jgi:asparagine synthase (glutamine-hydrolysing)